MAVATTTAIALGLGLAATGYQVYSGERANDAQTQARRRQQKAQEEALRIQMIERSRSAQAEMQANRARPPQAVDDGILNSTDRTGGIDDRLRLARPTKLGG